MFNWITVLGPCWLVHSLYSCCQQVLVGGPCPEWTGIVVHQNEIGAYNTGIWENTHIQDLIDISCSRRSAILNDIRVRFPFHANTHPHINRVCFPLHANTRPHINRVPNRTVRVSDAYGCETLIGGSPYPDSSISDVHAKSRFVSEHYWGPIIKGPSDLRVRPLEKCLDVVSRQWSADCWSSGPHASVDSLPTTTIPMPDISLSLKPFPQPCNRALGHPKDSCHMPLEGPASSIPIHLFISYYSLS